MPVDILDQYFRLGSTPYARWHADCSGKPQCSTPGAQQDTTSAQKCGTFYMADYGRFTQYMYMDYYCIDGRSEDIERILMGLSPIMVNANIKMSESGPHVRLPFGRNYSEM